jgi:hypothetical protein
MECRKCGSEIPGDEYRMVAEWPFCMQCFERLLNRPAVPPPVQPPAEPPPSDPAGASPPPSEVDSSTAATLTCLLCESEIVDGKCERLASWVFCPSCFGSLIALPDEEEEPAAPRPKKSPLVPPTYAKTKSCKGCGRRIPERAAKELDGEPYCPDCFNAKSRAAGVVPDIRATIRFDGRAAQPRAATGRGCESCGREVAAASLQAVEGFVICQACLSTDADLALHLARQRHHLYLQRLKTNLDT